MRKLNWFPAFFALSFVSLAVSHAAAQTVTGALTASGYYRDDGFTDNTSGGARNYVSGYFNSSHLVNGFVIIAVPAGGGFTAATLHLSDPSMSNPPNTVQLFDVSTPENTLLTGAGGVSAYNDLGSGTSYGSATVNSSGGFVDFILNAQGLAAVNAASGGDLVFGISVTNATTVNGSQVFAASTTPNANNGLILTQPAAPAPVPTLTPWTLAALGLSLLAVGATVIGRRPSRPL